MVGMLFHNEGSGNHVFLPLVHGPIPGYDPPLGRDTFSKNARISFMDICLDRGHIVRSSTGYHIQ